MPPSQNSRPRQTAFSSDILFRNSSTTDIRHVYLLLAGRRDIRDNYATFIFLRQMIIQQEEESDRRLQHEQNKLALLREFAEASFQEACVGGLDTILQPMIHLREERNHHHLHRTGRSPPIIPSDSSSLPSPIQRSRQQPNMISQSLNNSGPSRPRAPLGLFHNPIVVEEDDSDDETRTPTNNTWCPRCHRYIHNSYHNEDYCDTIFVPGAPAMICHRCGLQGHVMLDCRETVCTWCERFGHFIENCPDLGWTFSNLGSSKLARVVLRFHPQHVRFHFYFSFYKSLEQHAMNACSSIFTFFHA